VTPDELIALYEGFRVSAYRLEAQQHYVVPSDEERQRAFHQEGRRLPPTPEKQETLDLITNAKNSGRRMGRVHIVERPLSDYVRYELAAAYPENVAAGEEVSIVERAEHPALAKLTRDFVIFDGGTRDAAVVWYDYDSGGRLTSYERENDPAVTQECWRLYQLARECAVDLDDYTAKTNKNGPTD
jgi:hypothetical protein